MSANVSHPQSNEPALSKGSEYRRGVLYGVIPLAVLAVITAMALALAALVRQLIGAPAFLAQQQAVLLILGCGLVLAIVAFTLAVIFTLRRVATWQRDGPVERARAALWTLSVSALVILLPVLLALVLPQHPAP